MKWCKEKKTILKTAAALLVAIICSPVLALAQTAEDLPCNGVDPYSNYCPLDTWSFLLVIAGIGLGVYKIHKLSRQNKIA